MTNKPKPNIIRTAMPVTLYKRQRELLDFLRQYISKHGFSPTLQEIADAMDLASLATVHEHLKALVKKGLIKKFEGAVRGIEILDDKMAQALKGIELPLVGLVAAGKPIEAIEDPTSTITVSPTLISGRKRAFVLQVKGDSMINDGIYDSDYVVIEQQNTAKDGDIVVALLGNGFATLKRYYREPNRIRLEPANDSMSPIFATNVTIQGKVRGIIRKFD